ncbi:FAD-dependent monooxygenase [Synechococcus sp. CS-1328]|uniref:FAD-dependent monooxygenase n=1 Tax=Synechococcus sp. CS-1328 TaxID=2847976 RepID=UPI00223B09EA|nr:FAD-dependent monooxygenase [Synechococcus sp. CS-1328]MCT0223579.1 FAD-dependent monooxygenase [Synechococcus sp. CS-1328]
MRRQPVRVLIVGGGPTGAALALLLSQRGIPFILIEASRSLDRLFRGEALMPSGLAALEQIGGADLLDGLPQRPLAGWRFVLDGRELFRAAEPLTPGPACTLVSQPALLERLLERAADCPGCQVLRGTAAAGLLEQNGRIAGVRLADGQELRADLVLACDGRSSSLRRQAGLELQEQSSPLDLHWFQLPGASTTSAAPPLPQGDWFTTVVGPAGIFSLFTGATGVAQLAWVRPHRAEATDPRQHPQAAAPWPECWARQSPPELAAWLRKGSVHATAPVPLAVRVGLAPLWHRPGLLLLGDAAHPMSPVRAQGINMGLRDALAAANHLIPLLAEGAQPATSQLDAALATIAAERLPEIQTLQTLQRQEAERGMLLQGQPWLRALLLAGAPLLAPALRHHWIEQQRPLRQGVTTLNLLESLRLLESWAPAMMQRPARAE